MRLPVSKAYRAFKELDRFSDEQCVTFARTARPRGWWWFLQAFLILMVSLIGLFGMLVASFYFMNRLFGNARYDGPVFYLVMLPTMAVTIGAGPLLGYVVRDFFLRRGIRRVLISRGSCPGCRYTITGLSVDDAGGVRCPECGTVTIADATLGETVSDKKGGRIFLPSPEAAEAAWPVFLSRARVVRWVKRFALIVALLVFLVGSFVAWWEWSVRSQAAAALAARNVSAFVEYSLSQQPEGVDSETDSGFDVITRVSADLSGRMQTLLPGTVWNPWGIDLRVLAEPGVDYPDPPTADERRRIVVESMLKLMRDGDFEPIKRLNSVRRAVHDPLPAPGQPVIGWSALGYSINPLWTINMARLKVASDAGDLEQFAAAAEAHLAISRLCASGSTSEVVLIGARAKIAALSVLVREVAARRDAKWIDAIEALVARQQRRENPAALADVRRLALRDHVCVFFSDPANFRFGRWSPMMRQARRGLPSGWFTLGTFHENIREIDRWHERTTRAVSAPDANWAKAINEAQHPSKLLLVNLLGGFHGNELKFAADGIMYRDALRAVIAIERHRLETGKPPARLEDLVPSRLESLPRDPYSGGVLKYRLEEKGRDPEGCGYVLYSVGQDGSDQGGNVPSDPQAWRVFVYGMPGNSGPDVVLSP